MPDVVIDIDTTVIDATILVEEDVRDVAINVQSSPIDADINVTTTTQAVVVDASSSTNTAVIIDVERGIVPEASPTVAGVVKLYNLMASNSDGAVAQNVISDNLNLKVDKEAGKSIVLDTEIAKIPHANRGSLDLVSGTNSGDQDLSNLAQTTYVDAQDALKVDKEVGKSLLFDTEITKLSKINSGKTEIDFGALPVSDKIFTITDANVSAASNITAAMAYDAATGKDLDETEMDALSVICGQAAAGSFKMFVKSVNGGSLADKFIINYQINP